MFWHWNLGKHDGDKHTDTADSFPHIECFMQNEPTADDGEGRLQAEYEGGNRRTEVFLTNDLQSVCNTAGEYTCIENGNGCGGQSGKIWNPLKQEHGNRR